MDKETKQLVRNVILEVAKKSHADNGKVSWCNLLEKTQELLKSGELSQEKRKEYEEILEVPMRLGEKREKHARECEKSAGIAPRWVERFYSQAYHFYTDAYLVEEANRNRKSVLEDLTNREKACFDKIVEQKKKQGISENRMGQFLGYNPLLTSLEFYHEEDIELDCDVRFIEV